MIYLKNVVTLRLDGSICNGCAMCTIVCPHQVFQISGKKAKITGLDRCMECGACAKNCKQGAITVRSGVGCAAGIIYGVLRGSEPTCGCTDKACC